MKTQNTTISQPAAEAGKKRYFVEDVELCRNIRIISVGDGTPESYRSLGEVLLPYLFVGRVKQVVAALEDAVTRGLLPEEEISGSAIKRSRSEMVPMNRDQLEYEGQCPGEVQTELDITVMTNRLSKKGFPEFEAKKLRWSIPITYC